MSKMYYTTKKTIIYNHIHEMSVTVLLDIYGTLMRSGNGATSPRRSGTRRWPSSFPSRSFRSDYLYFLTHS